jgi:protein-L-isoaspartate(D-aspartate) O-methyltransferase
MLKDIRRWLLAPAAALFTIPLLLANQSSWKAQRISMVEKQIVSRGIQDERVLEAMREVPRHHFVPLEYRAFAYQDSPQPIGYGQTISQPYIVAFMTEALDLKPQHKLFELGTGSGYQAAVASRIVEEVYTVEIHQPLAERAQEMLRELAYDNVHVRAGDGWAGWPDAAPFDRIIVTAAAPELPEILLEQLRVGGKLIMPLGPDGGHQELVLVEKLEEGKLSTKRLLPVRFVPVTGEGVKD